MATFSGTAKKLQNAINSRSGAKVTIGTSQFYSVDKKRPVMSYVVRESFPDDDYHASTVIFKTYSQIQLVLFLRDYWYELNGWEVPTDNKVWEEIKRQNGYTSKKET